MKKSVTILTTWDKEVIQLDTPFKNWLAKKMEAKKAWEDGLLISKTRYLKFANIKDERGKDLFLWLPAGKPSKTKVELTPEERKNRDEFLKKCLEKTKESRKKKFFEEREQILKQLAQREEYWWMETTLSKITALYEYRKSETLNKR